VETWGLGGSFAFGVCYSNKGTKVFFNKQEMIEYMLSRSFKNYIWYSHNIKYDISIIFGKEIFNKFKAIISSGRIIQLTYNEKGYNIYLRDSMNLFNTSLDKIGKLIGYEKLKTPLKFKIHPSFVDEINKLISSQDYDTLYETYGLTKEDIEEYQKGIDYTITKEDIDYCIRDCEVLYKAIEYFIQFISQFNIRLRPTIGANALAIFQSMQTEKESINVSGYDFLFRKSYYGGRTELFIESSDKKLNYYDFNSLYPSVMFFEKYPDPESLAYTNNPTIDLIENYEGVSYVKVSIPEDMFYPPLPYKLNDKLIFPVGTIKGWYNHNELRMAMKYGAKIKRIYKTVYATKTCNLFKEYIQSMYNLRLKYKKEKNDIMAQICKLLMNSLYGKFGQKNVKREIGTIADNKEGYVFEPIGKTDIGYWYLPDKNNKPVVQDAKHAILCWASYITSWARIWLYEKIQEVIKKGGKVYYCDTDSIICDVELETGKQLGQLKLEGVSEFVGYAPKTYVFDAKIKIKGIRRANAIKNEYREMRVIQPLEALRRNVEPGTPEIKIKKLSLTNSKRDKNKPININEVLRKLAFESRVNAIAKSLINELYSSRTNNIMQTEDGYIRFRSKPEFYYKIIDKYGSFSIKNLYQYAREMAEYEEYVRKMIEENKPPGNTS